MSRYLRLAALALLLAGGAHAQTNADATATPAPADPASQTTPATIPPSPTAADMEIMTLPDGTQVMAFNNKALEQSLPGMENITLPDGRKAVVLGHAPQPPLPAWAVQSIRVDEQRQVTYKTGPVTDKDAVLTIPYVYRKLFRVTQDVMYKPIFSKTEKLDVAAGTLGFYAGRFQTAGTSFGSAEMMCLLSGYETGKTRASCYLDNHSAGPWLGVTASGLIPASYSVMTSYGNPMYNPWGPPQIEDIDVTIPHDFSLILKITKWTDRGAEVTWSTDDGQVSKFDLFSPDSDRQVTFPIQGGKLVFARGTGKHDTIVAFVATPPQAPAADGPETPPTVPASGAN